MTMDVTVSRGQVQLNSIDLTVDEPNFKVIEVDASSKRYEIQGGTCYDSDGIVWEELDLIADENSKNIDESTDAFTRITLPVGSDNRSDWELMYDHSARYSFRIVMYKVSYGLDDEDTSLWNSDEDPVYDGLNNTFIYPDGTVEPAGEDSDDD